MARLLVVDDDPEILECLAILLSDRYQILTVKGGLEALKELQTQPFDAMVLDLVMPLMDGETLIERMRALGITVPLVLASASLEVSAIARAFGRGLSA
jgi:CheY-like chemotaxis protein